MAAEVARNVPAGHGTHALDAVFGLYVPAAHAVQDTAPVPELMNPAGQAEQALEALADAKYPLLHCAHVAIDVAPTADEKYPATQAVQVALLVAADAPE